MVQDIMNIRKVISFTIYYKDRHIISEHYYDDYTVSSDCIAYVWLNMLFYFIRCRKNIKPEIIIQMLHLISFEMNFSTIIWCKIVVELNGMKK